MNKIFVSLLVMFFIVGCFQKDVSTLKTEEKMKKEYRSMTLTNFMKLNKKEILNQEGNGNDIVWEKFSKWKYNKVENEIYYPLNQICYGQYGGSIYSTSTLSNFIPNILSKKSLGLNPINNEILRFYPCIVNNYENIPFGYLHIEKLQKDGGYLGDVYVVKSSDDLTMQLNKYNEAYKEKRENKKISKVKSRKTSKTLLKGVLDNLVKENYPQSVGYLKDCNYLSKTQIGCSLRINFTHGHSLRKRIICKENIFSGVDDDNNPFDSHSMNCK